MNATVDDTFPERYFVEPYAYQATWIEDHLIRWGLRRRRQVKWSRRRWTDADFEWLWSNERHVDRRYRKVWYDESTNDVVLVGDTGDGHTLILRFDAFVPEHEKIIREHPEHNRTLGEWFE